MGLVSKTLLGIAIAAKNNVVIAAQAIANTTKNLAIKTFEKSKTMAYKLTHKKSLGKDIGEINANLNDENRLSHSGNTRNIREAKYNKVDLMEETNKSNVDNIKIKRREFESNKIDFNNQINIGIKDMELNNEIEDTIIENKENSEMLRNIYDNTVSLKERIDSNNEELIKQNIEITNQKKRNIQLEKKYADKKKNVKIMEDLQIQGLQYSREEDLSIRNEDIAYLNKNKVEDEIKRGTVYKYDSKDGFSFYKLKDEISNGSSIGVAFDKAGMIPNVQYRLDRYGTGIIRVVDKNVVELAKDIETHLLLEDLVEDKKIVPCVYGVKGKTSFSIGILICDTNLKDGFGVILLKRDKEYANYVLDLNKKLSKNFMLEKSYCKFNASDSFLRQAFPCAICMDYDTGEISEKDIKMLKELERENIIAYMKADRLINKIRGNK